MFLYICKIHGNFLGNNFVLIVLRVVFIDNQAVDGH